MAAKLPPIDWFRRIPKVELHLHLEGSIRPSLLRKLASKNSVDLPPVVPDSREQDPVYRYSSFLEFLDCFKTACSVICSPEDLATAAEDLISLLVQENVHYAEIFISPVIHERKGVSAVETMKQIQCIAEERRRSDGFRCQFLFDAVRQWGVESCLLNTALAEECAGHGVVGIGIGGDESALPAEAFASVFEKARAAGLHITAHSGENAGPSSIRAAIRYLKPERIGHGIRAAEEPCLLEEIRCSGTTLDISITSNLRTAVWPQLENHPVKKIHAAGVRFTLNTDDPALFATTLSNELQIGSALLDLNESELQDLMINSIASSFLPEEDKVLLAERFRADFKKTTA